MLKETFPQIAPQAVSQFSEVLALHQAAVEFRQEVAARQAFAAYCQWYDRTAAQHQADLAAMRQDLQILSWFRR